jgi:hypothetical protein
MRNGLSEHHHYSLCFLLLTLRTLWMTAASKRIIAIPVVNHVVIGEITASRKGIRSSTPIKLPPSVNNCKRSTVSPDAITSSGTAI